MRKFSKILAVVLALCLICGAVVMSVGATSDEFTIAQGAAGTASTGKSEDLLLSDSSITNFLALDFETAATGKGTTVRGNKLNGFFQYGGTAKTIMYDIYKDISYGGAVKNTYFCYQSHGIWNGTFVDSYGAQYTNNYQIYLSTNIGSAHASATLATDVTNMTNYAYAVADFDIATDRLKYKNADGAWRVAYPNELTNTNGVWTLADGTVVTDVNLAYHDGDIAFSVFAPKAGEAGNKRNAKDHIIKFVEEDGFGVWSVYVNGVDTGKDLSSEVLEWNHFTVALVKDAANLANSMLYIYLDGECIHKDVANANGATNLFLGMVEIRNAAGELQKFNKSVALDNITSNYYPNGYTGSLATYFASEGSKEVADIAPIYNCTDIIYSATYEYPYPSAGTATLGDYTGYVPGHINDHLQANLATGDTITLNGKSIYNFVVPEGVDNFKVDVSNGATFSLKSGQLYESTLSGTTYNVTKVNYDREILVTYVDADGNVLGTETLVYNQTFTAPKVEIFHTLTSTKTQGTLTTTLAGGWKYDLDGDGTRYEPTDFTAVDKTIYAYLNRAQAGTGTMELTVTATSSYTEDTVITGYVVYTTKENGDVIVSAAREKTALGWDRTQALVDSWNAPDGSTMVMYVDTDSWHSSKGFIAVGNGKSLTFDVNGHQLRYAQNYGGTPRMVGMFNVGNGSTFTLTSSQPGAVLSHTYINNTSTGSGSSKELVNGGNPFSDGLIMFSNISGTVTTSYATIPTNNDVDGTTVNINGANITFNIGSLLKPSVGDEVTDGAANHVNINGGTYNAFYHVGNSSTYGTVFYANDNIVYSVENAAFYTGNNCLIATGSSKTSVTDMTFTNCQIFADEGVALLGATISTVDLTFNGCTIVGLDAVEGFNGNVTLGAGNKVAGTYAAKVADGVIAAYNNAEGAGSTVSLALSYPKNFVYITTGSSAGVPDWTTWTMVDETKTGTITLETFAEGFDPTENGYTKVEWLAPNGSVYATQYWYPGSTIDTIPEANFTDKTPNGDGWTAQGYDGWANAEGDALIVGTDNMSFSPAVVTVGYIIADMKANLDLAGNVIFNLYITAYEGENFEVTDAEGYMVSGNKKNQFEEQAAVAGFVTIDGVKYVKITVNYGAYAFDVVDTEITFTIDGTTYTGNVEVDLFKYVDAVVADPAYGCGSEAATLLFDMLQFKKEAYIYNYGYVNTHMGIDTAETVAKVDAYLAGHGDGCTCGTDLDTLVYEEDTAGQRGELDGKFTAVQYAMNSGAPSPVLYFDETFAATITDIEIRFQNGIENGYVQPWTTAISMSGGEIVKRSDGYRFTVPSVKMHMQACVMEIKVITEDATYTGLYSLAEYCQADWEDNQWTTVENDMWTYCRKVAKAFYAYSKSAFEFKTTAPAN